MKVVKTLSVFISVILICFLAKQVYMALVNTNYPNQDNAEYGVNNSYHESNIHQTVMSDTTSMTDTIIAQEQPSATKSAPSVLQPNSGPKELEKTMMEIGLYRRNLSSYSGGNLENGEINFPLLRQTKLNNEPPPIFPVKLQQLDGKTVSIIGFMTPYDDIQNMKNFMLMPASMGCYFCLPPSWKEVVLVQQNVENSEYISEAVSVEGTFSLWKEDHSDPSHDMFLFVINDAIVKKYEPGF